MKREITEITSSKVVASPGEFGRRNGLSHRKHLNAIRSPGGFTTSKVFAFLKVNEAAVQHYGYTEKEFPSMTIKDIRPPEDLPRLYHELEETRPEHGWNTSSRWKHIRKERSVIDVDITGFLLKLFTVSKLLTLLDEALCECRHRRP